MADPFRLARGLLFRLDAERAHHLAIAALKSGLLPKRRPVRDPMLAQTIAGLAFPNPVGLAAGFDKNAEAPDAMLAQGFGFVEVGTITPLPQPGNPKPRIFRLKEDEAVINRLGFNNGGLDRAAARLAARKGRPGLLGANVGANKDAADRIADYAAGIARLSGLCDYFTINISSPNTPGLRALQSRAALTDLLGRALAARDASGRPTPVFLKVAPDLMPADIDDIAEVAVASGIDGLIVSNTTIARPETLKSLLRTETGGLSGRPLMAPSTAILGAFRRRIGRALPLIGVGGVAGPEDAYAKIRAGASLVQLYSALVYQGPGLVNRINRGLIDLLKRDGFSHIGAAVGADMETG